jgi:hypothetical protein
MFVKFLNFVLTFPISWPLSHPGQDRIKRLSDIRFSGQRKISFEKIRQENSGKIKLMTNGPGHIFLIFINPMANGDD